MLHDRGRQLLKWLALATAAAAEAINGLYGAERTTAALALAAVGVAASGSPPFRACVGEVAAAYLTLSWFALTTAFVLPPDSMATVPTWLYLAIRYFMWRAFWCSSPSSRADATAPFLLVAIPEDVRTLGAWPPDRDQGGDAAVAVVADLALTAFVAGSLLWRRFPGKPTRDCS